jgi:undecaprenyl diphosphate synthase
METEIDAAIENLKKRHDLPRHIAIIMDGNGRWAKKRRLPRIAGHRAGKEAVRATVRTCARLGVGALSLYTFSLENWRRPRSEINALMQFLRTVLRSEYLELKDNNIRLRAIGRIDMLPRETHRTLMEMIGRLSSNTGMVLNLCLSYSGRAEIVDAVKGIVEAAEGGGIRADALDEELFSRYLYAPDLPDPDLLIRTSGELRISNFMLWELAYTEIVVMDVLWPDFRENHLIDAIEQYLDRERRFGALSRKPGGRR